MRGRVECGKGYFIPSFFTWSRKVEGGRPSISAAPPLPADEITVIPVAKVAYGFGGGRGQGSGGDGSGGGGGIRVSPVGYIEMRNGGAAYKPIRNWAELIPAIAAGGLLMLLCGKLFRR
jgi:hypothetical protein